MLWRLIRIRSDTDPVLTGHTRILNDLVSDPEPDPRPDPTLLIKKFVHFIKLYIIVAKSTLSEKTFFP
jgi:hypothetical protein